MRRTGLHVRRNSEAMTPEAGCRAGRPCLEGSESRNRLSEVLAWPAPFFCGSAGAAVRQRSGSRADETGDLLESEGVAHEIPLTVRAVDAAATSRLRHHRL